MEEDRNRNRKEEEKEISILYGLPFTPSSLPRLAQIARLFDSSLSSSSSSSPRKPKSVIGLFVDSPEHIQYLISFLENNHTNNNENSTEKEKERIWPLPIPLYIPIDVGDHREGISISPHSTQLVRIAAILHKYTNTSTKTTTSPTSNTTNKIKLAGFYTHRGGSYSASNPQEALRFMKEELVGLYEGAKVFLGEMERMKTGGQEEEEEQGGGKEGREKEERKMVLSLGATPTATAIQNLVWEEENETTEAVRKYRDILKQVQENFEVEFHAGVYPGMCLSFLLFIFYFIFPIEHHLEDSLLTHYDTHTIVMDMQQLATRARPHQSPISGQSLLSFSDLGFRILVEVASLYFDRGEKPEALIAAGGIVFGREPCKSYPGWGVVTPWPATSGQVYDPEGDRTGWIVGRISQEHGNLTWEGSQDQFRKLELGEKLLVWPNHACIAGVNFGCYLVVDSDQADPDRIQDVWVRWRGW